MYKVAILVYLVLQQIQSNHCIIDVEKLVCTTYDKNFSRFDLCELHLTKPETPSMSFKIHLFQLPVTNCDVHLEWMFLSPKFTTTAFNGTWDACRFMKNTKRYMSLFRFYSLISNSSNLNHTCPYNHDLEFINIAAGNLNFPMPIPRGDYVLKTQYFVDKKLRLGLDYFIKRVITGIYSFTTTWNLYISLICCMAGIIQKT